PEISDANYLKGTVIPFGTRVQVLEVRKSSVKFQPAGHPPITLVLKYGKDAIGMDQYLDLVFLREDPHAKLPKPGKEKKQAAAAGPRSPLRCAGWAGVHDQALVPAQRRSEGGPAAAPSVRAGSVAGIHLLAAFVMLAGGCAGVLLPEGDLLRDVYLRGSPATP